jgi:hypothetical protein
MPKPRRRVDEPAEPTETAQATPLAALLPPIELKAVETPATLRDKFFTSCTWSADGEDVQASTMSKAYGRWCRERGADNMIMSQQAFGRHDDCPYRKDRCGGTVYYFDCAVTEGLIDKKSEQSARSSDTVPPAGLFQ